MALFFFPGKYPLRLHACVLSCFSRVQLSVTLWTVARQAPLSMRFSRQEYWHVLLCPPSKDLPNTGIKPTSLLSPTLAGIFFTSSPPWKYILSLVLNFITRSLYIVIIFIRFLLPQPAIFGNHKCPFLWVYLVGYLVLKYISHLLHPFISWWVLK